MNRKLVIGTAQFGLAYGLANTVGRVGRVEAEEILKLARTSGINTLDTASAYGDSELQLGKYGVSEWRVISKILAVPEHCSDARAWVVDSTLRSLENLRIARLYGLLLHRPLQLLSAEGPAIFEGLSEIKRRGLTEKIGISIYAPEDLKSLWPRYKFDLVQGPLSIFDRRLRSSGWLARLSQAKVEIHIRSIFLQGLLLMKPAARPERFLRWGTLWKSWDDWLADQSVTALQACLDFGLAQPEVDGVVIGVDSPGQLLGILECLNRTPTPPPPELQSDDIDLINPARWSIS